MIKKTIFLLLFFYFLTLIQTSFLVHFYFFRIAPNLVFIAVILINLFIPSNIWWGIIAAFWGGFFLDIFSLSNTGFFGVYTLISVCLALFIKFILKKHVRVPILRKL